MPIETRINIKNSQLLFSLKIHYWLFFLIQKVKKHFCQTGFSFIQECICGARGQGGGEVGVAVGSFTEPINPFPSYSLFSIVQIWILFSASFYASQFLRLALIVLRCSRLIRTVTNFKERMHPPLPQKKNNTYGLFNVVIAKIGFGKTFCSTTKTSAKIERFVEISDDAPSTTLTYLQKTLLALNFSLSLSKPWPYMEV